MCIHLLRLRKSWKFLKSTNINGYKEKLWLIEVCWVATWLKKCFELEVQPYKTGIRIWDNNIDRKDLNWTLEYEEQANMAQEL